MTNTEAASIIALFHGAFPSVFVDEAVVEFWANALATSDFPPARQAAIEWTTTMTRFPTVAEFRAEVRRIREKSKQWALPTDVVKPDISAAKAAFESGFRAAKQLAGADPDEIDTKLTGYLRGWSAPETMS
jgi:hypothetical protein